MTTDIGLRRALDLPYEAAIERATAALKSEGFGVLTHDIGACDPTLAHQAKLRRVIDSLAA